jgi:arginine decarboxylase
MEAMTPTKLFLTKGVGIHQEKLNSFELALRNAEIAKYNLVSVSSIFPPGAKIISRKEGLAQLNPGQIVYAVMSRNSTCEPSRLISASVGVAIPQDPRQYGYLSEHHAYGWTGRHAGDYAEDLAVDMLATTMGLKINLDKSWDENKEIWKVQGKVIRTRNTTQSAKGHKSGRWTTVVAAAIMVI